MSPLRLTLASLLYHWRTNFAVACGVAVCTAVLTGALLVGDSMRGSLRHLTLDRLGRIDEALVTSHFFRAALAEEAGQRGRAGHSAASEPGNRRFADRRDVRIGCELIGCDERFWQLGDGRPRRLPGPREIVLNQPAAERLGVRVGDAVLLRLPTLDAIPADSALGKKRETVRTQRVTVSEIIAAEGLGTLQPSAHATPAAKCVRVARLARRAARSGGASQCDPRGGRAPRSRCAPGYSDYGLHVERTPSGYWNITSDRMMLDPATERELLKGLRAMPDVAPRRSAGDDLPGQHVGLQRPRSAVFDDHGHRLRRAAAAGPVSFDRRKTAAAAGPERNRA